MKNKFMLRAIELGINAMREGTGGPFGAIIVRNDKIIGQGQNRVLERCDPTAHAEMEAIRNACEGLKSFELKGCDIYSSCEPCPMCFSQPSR
jgi:tRNA(Arg) A34 adenosine deaminase TadA